MCEREKERLWRKEREGEDMVERQNESGIEERKKESHLVRGRVCDRASKKDFGGKRERGGEYMEWCVGRKKVMRVG